MRRLEKEHCNVGSQNDQAGRHLRRSLAQPPAQGQAKLWDQTRLLQALFSQFLITSKDRNCISSIVKLFPCLAVLMAGSSVPQKQSSPATPPRATPPASLIIWPSPELHPVYQYLLCTGGLTGCRIPDGLMSAAWKGIVAFLNLLTVLLLKQLIPNTCSCIFVQNHTTNL